MMKNKLITKTKFFLLISLSFIYLLTFGHGGEDHSKKKKDSTNIETESIDHKERTDESHEHSQVHHHPKTIKAGFDEFPTLHPLVIHFPIVLLLIAAISQVAGLFVFKKGLSWVTLILIAGGFTGAYIAGNFMHPHTHDLSEYAEKVLKEHENYASYTTWLAGIALLFKAASHFLFNRKLWGEAVVTVIMIASAYTVSITGHYGAQLIHIEGVGVKGEYLEINTDNHQH